MRAACSCYCFCEIFVRFKKKKNSLNLFGSEWDHPWTQIRSRCGLWLGHFISLSFHRSCNRRRPDGRWNSTPPQMFCSFEQVFFQNGLLFSSIHLPIKSNQLNASLLTESIHTVWKRHVSFLTPKALKGNSYFIFNLDLICNFFMGFFYSPSEVWSQFELFGIIYTSSLDPDAVQMRLVKRFNLPLTP